MVKYVCDRCGQGIEVGYKYHMSYSGGGEVELCIKCFKEFSNWMENKTLNIDELSKIEKYDKVVDALNCATDDRDWWRAQCKWLYKSVYDLNKRAGETFKGVTPWVPLPEPPESEV